MLVLSRQVNESIVINHNITITVVEIRTTTEPAKVRLGIVSPKEVPVHRQEVYELIHGQAATTSNGAPLSPAARENLERLLADGTVGPKLERLLAKDGGAALAAFLKAI